MLRTTEKFVSSRSDREKTRKELETKFNEVTEISDDEKDEVIFFGIKYEQDNDNDPFVDLKENHFDSEEDETNVEKNIVEIKEDVVVESVMAKKSKKANVPVSVPTAKPVEDEYSDSEIDVFDASKLNVIKELKKDIVVPAAKEEVSFIPYLYILVGIGMSAYGGYRLWR